MPSNVTIFLIALLAVLVMVAMQSVRRLRAQRNTLRGQRDVVLSFMYDVADVFAEGDNVTLSALLKRVVQYALRSTGAGGGAIYVLDEADRVLRAASYAGIFPPIVQGMDGPLPEGSGKTIEIERRLREEEVTVGEGLIGEVAASGKPLLIPHADMDPRIPGFEEEYLRVRSMLLVPMRFHDQVLGVLVVINRVDESPFIEAHQDILQALADQASVSVHHMQFSETLSESRQLQSDLRTAAQIQTALLPKDIPDLPGCELAAFSVPAQKIGGDYYDFVQLDDTHLGMAIADVSGKGVSAGLVMAICRSALRGAAHSTWDPARVLKEVNRVVADDLQEDMFISMLYMVLCLDSAEIVFARAGHTQPVIHPGDGTEPWCVQSKGMAIGIGTPDMFDAAIEDHRIQLAKGDTVIAYTDGVTEAQTEEKGEWGLTSLIDTVRGTLLDGGGAADVTHNVRSSLQTFLDDEPQYDDMTLLAVRYLGSKT